MPKLHTRVKRKYGLTTRENIKTRIIELEGGQEARAINDLKIAKRIIEIRR